MQRKAIKVALVGTPNVGKSVIFNYLTGAYVTVSNYPGTTVDISRGRMIRSGEYFEIVDTPGIYSLMPLTGEEWVTRRLLIDEKPDIVIHVIDAKNVGRMLALTLQLLEAEMPLILVLNIMDEAYKLGVTINLAKLSAQLGIPVVATTATEGSGLNVLKEEILHYNYQRRHVLFNYDSNIEICIQKIIENLNLDCGLSKRQSALLLLQGDAEWHELIRDSPGYDNILITIRQLTLLYNSPLDYTITVQRQSIVNQIMTDCVKYAGAGRTDFLLESIGRWTRKPLSGIPILLVIMYFGLFKFVGGFGAGYLVDYLNNTVFGVFINPWVESAVRYCLPNQSMQSLLIGEYGIYSMGFRYAVAIILPVVGTFFLAFSVLEDSGYLPRLAMLVDIIFKKFGLNGRSVIPLILGLGCGTMAVIVTRTLETKRERLLATFLLALTIPCSAQLGLVMALLAHNSVALMFWAAYIWLIFIITGWLNAHILPGNSSSFYIELPPLRLPLLSNIIIKTYSRTAIYLLEIVPVFIFASLILWLGDSLGTLQAVINAVKPVITALGLPDNTAQSFMMGFFRRDYGAAGLYDMFISGFLNDRQLLVSSITLTLFVPCLAQFVVLVKERGLLLSLLMIMIIAFIAVLSGIAVNIFIRHFNLFI